MFFLFVLFNKMSINVMFNNTDDEIGRLNDSFFQSQQQAPNIDSSLLSPTDEILKKIRAIQQFY